MTTDQQLVDLVPNNRPRARTSTEANAIQGALGMEWEFPENWQILCVTWCTSLKWGIEVSFSISDGVAQWSGNCCHELFGDCKPRYIFFVLALPGSCCLESVINFMMFLTAVTSNIYSVPSCLSSLPSGLITCMVYLLSQPYKMFCCFISSLHFDF